MILLRFCKKSFVSCFGFLIPKQYEKLKSDSQADH